MKKDLEIFRKAFKADLTNIFRDATTRTASNFVTYSPVDRGDFVSDWDVEIESYPTDQKRDSTIVKKVTRDRLKQTINELNYGETIFFQNDDDMSIRLEYGYSPQAPRGRGVVRGAARNWRRFVRGAAIASMRRIKKRLSGV